MQFRCPNCQHPIRVEDHHHSVLPEAETMDTIECPSCHSRFSLSADEDSTTTVTLGLKVAHFEIQQVLGEGAFGTVYKAFDTELQRHVALKVPRDGRITKETSNMFLREARAAAGITHPNVVTVYEMGQHGESFYIASELIEGITLSEYLRNRIVEPLDAARIMIKLLGGMKVFHDKGIIHRDIKPGNILLDSNNEPHISDFGLARSEDLTDVTVTNSGRIVGTLLYMPPEQAKGDTRSLSTRSDIYAMGVILFEMITGRRPFASTNSRTLIYSILTDEPPRPISLKKTIPRDLETICLKAMEKEPARRFESAEEMLADLQRFIEGRPILSRPISAPERFWRFTCRHRISSALAAVMIPLVVTLAYLMLRPEKVTIVQSDPIIELIETPPLTHPVRFRFSLSGQNVPSNAMADWTILPLDKRTREPVAEDAIRIAAAPTAEQQLRPGEYLVIANVPGFGFHEVYRYIPEDPSAATKAPYPHERWAVASDGTLEMPPLSIQSEAVVMDGMVRVPGGSFEMGDEVLSKPRHTRDVDDFFVDAHEVSADDFSRVIELSSDYQFPRGKSAVCVQWNAAVAYAESVGKRLLKEHEFEYLASNQGKSDFPTGDAPVVSSDEFWPYLEVGLPESDKLVSLPVFGLHSNVAEWTDSLINHYPGAMDPGPEGDRFINKQAQRVVRGGPVKLGPNDRTQNKWDKTARYRSAWEARTIDSEIGFRCGRSAVPRYAAP